jgi:ribosomal protein S18 acetylase RimI-like enzyme
MLAYVLRGPVTNAELNALFSAGSPTNGWPSWQKGPDTSDWQPVLDQSLAYITARSEGRLVGFVNVAWDGRDHAFLLDPRVHPDFRHQGIGIELVRLAARASAAAGCEVLHVDYAKELGPFYDACGFKPTAAGIIRLI